MVEALERSARITGWVVSTIRSRGVTRKVPEVAGRAVPAMAAAR